MNRWKIVVLASIIAVDARAAEGWLLPQLRPSAAVDARGGHALDVRGVNALGADPSGLASSPAEVFTQYQPLMQGMASAIVAASLPLTSRTTLALDVMRLGGASEEGRDETGRPTGAFRSEQRLIGLAAATGRAAWSFGAEVKRFDARVADSSKGGWLGDAGFRLHPEASRLSASLSLRNAGLGGADAGFSPMSLGAAARLRLTQGLSVSSGYDWRSVEKKGGASAGLEWTTGGRLALRTGAAAGGGLTAGFGLRLSGAAGLDYSFKAADTAPGASRATANHRLSLTYRRASRQGA